MKLPIEQLRKMFQYNPETGSIVRTAGWEGSGRRKDLVGKEVGNTRYDLCTRVNVDNLDYAKADLAWALHYGVWPSKEIDHIDMNRTNNRIANLRECNRSQNMANTKVRPTSKTGYKGVVFRKNTGKYYAHICHNYKCEYLGTFDTAEAVAAAYDAKAVEYWGDFARTNAHAA